MTEGIVSAVRDFMGGLVRIQITAGISPGSSGSPVMDRTGDVIGVATYSVSEAHALNFAVPSMAVRKLASDAQTQPYAFTPFLLRASMLMCT